MPILVHLVNLVKVLKIVRLGKIISAEIDCNIVLLPLQGHLFGKRHQNGVLLDLRRITAVLDNYRRKMDIGLSVEIDGRPVQKYDSVR